MNAFHSSLVRSKSPISPSRRNPLSGSSQRTEPSAPATMLTAMEVDRHVPEDPFLAFIEYARSALESDYEHKDRVEEPVGPGWSWIASKILRTCTAYSSGVTAAILLSDLSQAWSEQNRVAASRKRPECIKQLKKNHRRTKLPNTVTIDSIFKKNFLSLSSVLEAVIVDASVLPGTNIYMLSLGDFWSSNTIDLFLHCRYYDLVNPQNGILRKGREIFLTGCHLRTAAEGSGYTRLLPTEYLVVVLDEEQDDDAMLLGAQFCSDSFASISLDAANEGASYSLYARIESIGPDESPGGIGSTKRKQITLVDSEGDKLKFLLWGDQILLANLFSVGSMIALDKPYIASFMESALETAEKLCLEYGSATQIYLVPFNLHEEQVSVALSQNRHQGSRLLSVVDPSQAPMISQVTLPCDSQGSVDFTSYPFQPFVSDLRNKMTAISLYGVVSDIHRDESSPDVVFSLRLEDATGAIWARLHFAKFWSLKRLSYGHTVYISGLTCSITKAKRLEVLWHEKNAGASLVNLSALPAILNSSCLHKQSRLSDISTQSSGTYICKAQIDQVDLCHIDTRYSHILCGHFVRKNPDGCFECRFCRDNSFSHSEVVSAFYLRITLTDERAKVVAWCTGQTATELLQISPDEFNNLPEDEQLMYSSSLENLKFMVALVSCRSKGRGLGDGISTIVEDNAIQWEITCALKCD